MAKAKFSVASCDDLPQNEARADGPFLRFTDSDGIVKGGWGDCVPLPGGLTEVTVTASAETIAWMKTPGHPWQFIADVAD